jgi:hypothetical protein
MQPPGLGCQPIQAAIQSLPPFGGVVALPSGVFTCTEPIIIDRDNVTLRGQGAATVLRLANNANAPVVIIGQPIAVPSQVRRNITVADLYIDGNRAQQQTEFWPTFPAVRNNGISIRKVEDVVVERVTVARARSGGLVTELGSRRVTVRGLTALDNAFDGLAGYQTEDSLFTDLLLHDNLGAGLSFDIQFNRNIVSDTTVTDNATVGIFMRDSLNNMFQGLIIRGSGEHGVFLAQVDNQAHTPASGNTFSGVVVQDSDGAGLRVNDASVVNTLVSGAQFVGNGAGCISTVTPNQVLQVGVICR